MTKKLIQFNSKIFLQVLATFILSVTSGLADSNNYWMNASISDFNKSNERTVFPDAYLPLQLDIASLRADLLQAPKEFSVSINQGLVFTVPMPDGTFKRFSVLETEVMDQKLATKYPLIKTYVAKGIDDTYSWMRFDVGYLGFHAMIATLNGIIFIDPINNTEPENYICYYKNDMPNAFDRHCSFENTKSQEEKFATEITSNANRGIVKFMDSGDELRTYRLALACTGEYAATKGGTIIGALSGMVTSVNRVNGIYETEVAVRMVLIANTDTLIFLSASTDPYSNNNGGTMLGQNQTVITARIGSANYDFGHVFSTGGGGIAGLGVICDNSQKANGVTGLPNPVGDPFDVDYVAHEIGHQFGANHAFNSNAQGSCASNASMGSNFEPGSGSTIMCYAGLCASHDLQANSDPIFHAGSYNDIFNFSILGFGNTCASTTFTNNSPPIINPLTDYTIPFRTPFKLTGSASDPDGDSLTYIWEQYDSGPFGSPNSPAGNAAIFRDFTPSTDSTRTFPKLSTIIANNNPIGERLPTYARVLHFRFTARDNKIGGGGVAVSPTDAAITVINTTTPFLVTAPNQTATTWHFDASEQVTWDVSSTDLSPINCATVNILLSIDGGYTFPYVLVSNTPNDGNENVLISSTGNVPYLNTVLARIKVEGAGNIFFDMSNANFTLAYPTGTLETFSSTTEVSVYPNPNSGDFNVGINSAYTGKMTLTVSDFLGRIIQQKEILKTEVDFKVKIDLENQEKGIYFIEVKASDYKYTKLCTKL